MPASIALGILAGGRGSRLGGRDKGWVEVDGVAQIRRVLDLLSGHVDRVLVSANRHLDEYRALGVEIVPDRWPDFPGPFAGLASLFSRQREDWLLTVPVDVQRIPADFVPRLAAVQAREAFHVVLAEDDDGLQPLLARYPAALAANAIENFEVGKRSVREWQQRFPLYPCRFTPWRFGNLNTPDDLNP
jgi:molybdopterin-guanine dinucleotide biosynthesis protein A